MRYFEWPRYVPVAERRANAAAALQKLMKKKGLIAQPVEISGRKIADSFWGKGWCDHMESFNDYANRLPRGRTYVRNGSVCHLEIKPGRIEAMVSGSTLYNVVIGVAPLAKTKWNAVKSSCVGGVGSLIDLLRGKLSSGVMEVVCHQKTGLFPLPGEIEFRCDCPDSAIMCKHVAAVLYGVGARLDHAPEKLFLLRGVNHEEMVDLSAAGRQVATAGTSRRRMAPTALADVFGIDLAGAGDAGASAAAPARASASAPAPAPAPARASARASASAPAPAGASFSASASAPASVSGFDAATASGGRSSGAGLTNVSKAKGVPVQAAKAAKGAKGAKGARPAKQVAEIVAQTVPPAGPPFPKRLTGKVILSWRTALGETQLQFASRIGVSAACISQWEKKLRETLQVRERALEALKDAWKVTQG